MATEAQIAANRLNAQKSTGPRTAAGKAVVSQNAVTHGLLAREGVLRGEDWEEFQRHREMLLEELRPAGALEVILAARIVDLTWRLHRAAQDQNETFGALYDRHTAGAPEPAGPAERGATLGRMILEDLSRDAVLERLLRQERRIEGSLYRTLSELQRVHDQGRKADLEAANTLERWQEEDDRARKAPAFPLFRSPDSPSRPDGGTTNTPRFEVAEPRDIPSWPDTRPAAEAPAGNETCETNPICPEPEVSQVPCGTAVMSDSAPNGLRKTNPIYESPRLEGKEAAGSGPVRACCDTGILPVVRSHGQDAHATHGRDAHATEPPGGSSAIGVQIQEPLCETNPIGPGPRVSQVPCGTAVMGDAPPHGLRQTNPMCEFPRLEVTEAAGSVPVRAYCDMGILPVIQSHGQDAHATVPPASGTTNRMEARRQSCETNPICLAPRSRRGRFPRASGDDC